MVNAKVTQISAPPRGAAKWLTFEYLLAMSAAVMAALLAVGIVAPMMAMWVKSGSFTAGIDSWLTSIFSIHMPSGTSLILGSVLVVMLSLVALFSFKRVSLAVPVRPGYTERIEYKLITYGGMLLLVIPALVLVGKLITILISSLLFIGVSGAGEVYKGLYLHEFLSYLLGLGILAFAIFCISKIIGGVNASRLMSFVLLGVGAAMFIAVAITTAIKAHDGDSSNHSDIKVVVPEIKSYDKKDDGYGLKDPSADMEKYRNLMQGL